MGMSKLCHTLEFDLDLLLLWFETEDFSFTCFLTVPVTTSNIVGRSFIILKRRFLHQNNNNLLYNEITKPQRQQPLKWWNHKRSQENAVGAIVSELQSKPMLARLSSPSWSIEKFIRPVPLFWPSTLMKYSIAVNMIQLLQAWLEIH